MSPLERAKSLLASAADSRHEAVQRELTSRAQVWALIAIAESVEGIIGAVDELPVTVQGRNA